MITEIIVVEIEGIKVIMESMEIIMETVIMETVIMVIIILSRIIMAVMEIIMHNKEQLRSKNNRNRTASNHKMSVLKAFQNHLCQKQNIMSLHTISHTADETRWMEELL